MTAEVDCAMRDATRRNHTATHLFHAALRKVLGLHVKQAGLLVAPDRLRFDFMHFSAVMRGEQLDQIERMVNEAIVRNEAVNTTVRNTQEAMPAVRWRCSARIRRQGSGCRHRRRRFSTELCGGTHVRATGDIGVLLITEESGVSPPASAA